MTQQLLALRPAEPAPPPTVLARRAEPSAQIASAPAAAPAEPVLPNPQLRLDAALGLVVLEFRDRGGQARTIPTERELDAYRNNARSPAPAEEPAATPAPKAAEPASAPREAPPPIPEPEAS